jgi:uncharacterized lipoprotein
MLKKSLNLIAASLLLGGLVACDVNQTKEGDVTLPKYDVNKTQDGNVTAPAYDVTPPDVTVSKEQRTVEVPTVKTEERQITVPNVDVKPAPDR